jgi:hypothetical protein
LRKEDGREKKSSHPLSNSTEFQVLPSSHDVNITKALVGTVEGELQGIELANDVPSF